MVKDLRNTAALRLFRSDNANASNSNINDIFSNGTSPDGEQAFVILCNGSYINALLLEEFLYSIIDWCFIWQCCRRSWGSAFSFGR